MSTSSPGGFSMRTNHYQPWKTLAKRRGPLLTALTRQVSKKTAPPLSSLRRRGPPPKSHLEGQPPATVQPEPRWRWHQTSLCPYTVWHLESRLLGGSVLRSIMCAYHFVRCCTCCTSPGERRWAMEAFWLMLLGTW